MPSWTQSSSYDSEKRRSPFGSRRPNVRATTFPTPHTTSPLTTLQVPAVRPRDAYGQPVSGSPPILRRSAFSFSLLAEGICGHVYADLPPAETDAHKPTFKEVLPSGRWAELKRTVTKMLKTPRKPRIEEMVRFQAETSEGKPIEWSDEEDEEDETQ